MTIGSHTHETRICLACHAQWTEKVDERVNCKCGGWPPVTIGYLTAPPGVIIHDVYAGKPAAIHRMRRAKRMRPQGTAT